MDKRLVVVLHGYGMSGEEMRDWLDSADDQFFPDAPMRWREGCFLRSWFLYLHEHAGTQED